VAYGDLGKGEEDGSDEHWEVIPSLATTKNVIERVQHLHFAMHIGDISYAVGYSSQWDEFFHQIYPIASRIPYMTSIGNHERDYPDSGSHYDGTDSGGECGVPYESLLSMPAAGKDKPWYSFDYGNIHITMMSTEHNYDIGSEQHQFLERDLANVDRSKTPWLIFSGHRPMYIDSSTGGEGGETTVAKELRDNLEYLLFKYRVDLALWGHHHSYQRTCPVYKEQCVHGATTHVVIGIAGMSLSHTILPTPPSWIVYVDDKEYGYTLINTTQTGLTMGFYNNNNDLKDQFTLVKYLDGRLSCVIAGFLFRNMYLW